MKLSTKTKIQFAKFMYQSIKALRSMSGKSMNGVNINKNGINWQLDLDEGVDLSIYLFGCFEKDTTKALESLLNQGDTVLDIGANIGAHTLPIAKWVGKKGKVISFEATDWAYAKQKVNILLNPEYSSRISAYQCLLTNDEESNNPIDLYSSWNLNETSDQHEIHYGNLKSTEGAKVTSLDNLIAEVNISKIDLIKLDVDGYEFQVLKGASRIITQYKPKILIELCPYIHVEYGHTFEKLVSYLYSFEYKLYDLNGKILPTDINELISIIPQGGAINALAKI